MIPHRYRSSFASFLQLRSSTKCAPRRSGQLTGSAFYQAGRDEPSSDKVDVRFVRPDVAVVYEYEEVVGSVEQATARLG
jgi:hypothetical protein